MSQNALERLRHSNPVAGEPAPPPFASVLAHVQAATRPERPVRRRWLGGIVPVLGVTAAIAVAAVAIVVFRHGRPPATPANRQHPPAGPYLPIPHGGMSGVVMVSGAAFPGAPGGILSIDQCSPCQGPAGQHRRTWQAVTRNGGRTWALRQGPSLGDVQFSGPSDGWAVASAYAANGGMTYHGEVTHDGGRTWQAVTGTGGRLVTQVSIAGGTVWATAVWPGCLDGRTCPGATILTGPASGSTLTATAGQPVTDTGPAELFAAGSGTAYLDDARGINRVRHLVTRDGGRSWQALPKFCPDEGADTTLTLDSPTSLWRFCWNGRPPVLLGRSTDGGRHWTGHAVPAPGPRPAPYRFQAVPGGVAWELTDHGDVRRISDGGTRSQVVWTRSASQRTVVKGVPEALTVHDARTAYVTVVVPAAGGAATKGSNIVVYRTTDAGRTWISDLVPLPRGVK
jgi:hypothetical protein